MRLTSGGITYSELKELPIGEYKILKKAAEIEEIDHRRMSISDINVAFSGSQDMLERLNNRYNELTNLEEFLNKTPDPNWDEKMKKYKSGKVVKNGR